jgi:hypothetical protein
MVKSGRSHSDRSTARGAVHDVAFATAGSDTVVEAGDRHDMALMDEVRHRAGDRHRLGARGARRSLLEPLSIRAPQARPQHLHELSRLLARGGRERFPDLRPASTMVPAGSPRRSARLCRMNPATSIGGASPSIRLGCGTRTPMSTLPAYVVQGRSNTVGVLSIGAGWEEGSVRSVEPRSTIEDHSPRVLPSLRGLSWTRGPGDHVSAVLPPERRIDVVQDVHGLHVGGRSLPRFAS